MEQYAKYLRKSRFDRDYAPRAVCLCAKQTALLFCKGHTFHVPDHTTPAKSWGG